MNIFILPYKTNFPVLHILHFLHLCVSAFLISIIYFLLYAQVFPRAKRAVLGPVNKKQYYYKGLAIITPTPPSPETCMYLSLLLRGGDGGGKREGKERARGERREGREGEGEKGRDGEGRGGRGKRGRGGGRRERKRRGERGGREVVIWANSI